MSDGIQLSRPRHANTLGRAILLGAIAGFVVATGYVILIGVYTVYGQSGRILLLGGYAFTLNDVPTVKQPDFVLYATIAGMALWGLLIARIVPSPRRPAWWKLLPIMWVYFGVAALLGHALMRQLGRYAMMVASLVGFATSGLLLGWALRSRKAAAVLMIATPLAYALALLIDTLVPAYGIVALLTRYARSVIPFLQAEESLHQTAIWILHGALTGAAVWLVCGRDRANMLQTTAATVAPNRRGTLPLFF